MDFNSQFGKPGYRLQSREVTLSRATMSITSFLAWESGRSIRSPGAGSARDPWVRSYNNTFLVEDVPLFYSPYLAGPADNPNIPLRQLQFGQDRRRYGSYIRTQWDLYGLLGSEEPPGLQLNLLADYYSKRGGAGGLLGNYSGEELFGDDRYRGTALGYYLNDNGLWISLACSGWTFRRHREPLPVQVRHRHEYLPYDMRFNAGTGHASDRNFLEQFFQNEHFNDKDQENLLYGTGSFAPWGASNWALEGLGQVRLDDYETTTGWYPKADLWGLSESLFDGYLTWSNHSQLGYGDIQPANPYPETFFQPLPYAPDVEGLVSMTRTNSTRTLPLGPVNVTPFVMGEGAFWDQGIDGSQTGRLVGRHWYTGQHSIPACHARCV